MPLLTYGVLSAHVVGTRRESGSDSPHYQIHLADDGGTHYRAAVNVLSAESPSQLRYLVIDDFRHPLTASLPAGAIGWTSLPPGPGHANLDYVRANLFDPSALRLLPPDAAGPASDLEDLLDHYVQRAVNDPSIVLHVFGARWGPENGTPDKIFGFEPGNGVHDIHMNQGNSAAFATDDGVWQDGGVLIQLTAEARWVAIFLAFQSQSWHTDDGTGHTIPATPTEPDPADPAVRIVAAVANPVGPAPEAETVTLLNASAAAVDLTGWRLADRTGRSCVLPAGPLAAGATLLVRPDDGVALGNNGGTITLIDDDGRKVDGVAYTKAQATREGWTIVF